VAGYYSATRRHRAGAPLADFVTAAHNQAMVRRKKEKKEVPLGKSSD
jgi:hypothetical protein